MLHADQEIQRISASESAHKTNQASEFTDKGAPAVRSIRLVPDLALQLRCTPSGLTIEG